MQPTHLALIDVQILCNLIHFLIPPLSRVVQNKVFGEKLISPHELLLVVLRDCF